MISASISHKPKLYYMNPFFDLSLGDYSIKKHYRSVHEMSCLFVSLATLNDKIICPVDIPEAFWHYLSSYGIVCAGKYTGKNQTLKYVGEPWGWNSDAVKILTNARAVCDHPPLSTVKYVNSRRFSLLVNKRGNSGVPFSEFCETKADLIKILRIKQRYPIVIKPEFGNAGYGFIMKQNSKIEKHEHKQIEYLFQNNKGVVIEPWLKRTLDISSRCHINKNGTTSEIQHHTTMSNRAGAFFADILDPYSEIIKKWKHRLDYHAINSAKEIAKAGYFGPVGFDSFLFTNNSGDSELAPVIEINARHAISSIAYALQQRLTPDSITMFRFISRKKHVLPDTYEEFLNTIGPLCFSQHSQRGVIITTPLRVSHQKNTWVQPQRSGFFIADETKESLLNLDKHLRTILL